MKYGLYPPPAHLREIVRYFWVYESNSRDTMPTEYQGMADCCPELIFQYDGRFVEYENYGAYLRGPRSASRVLHLGERLGLFGIRLFPHAINQLLRIPNIELVNSSFELTHVLGKRHHDVIQQMMDACSDEARIKVASDFIFALSQNADNDPIHECVRIMLQREGEVDLDELRSITGLSVKQFERRLDSVNLI